MVDLLLSQRLAHAVYYQVHIQLLFLVGANGKYDNLNMKYDNIQLNICSRYSQRLNETDWRHTAWKKIEAVFAMVPTILNFECKVHVNENKISGTCRVRKRDRPSIGIIDFVKSCCREKTRGNYSEFVREKYRTINNFNQIVGVAQRTSSVNCVVVLSVCL